MIDLTTVTTPLGTFGVAASAKGARAIIPVTGDDLSPLLARAGAPDEPFTQHAPGKPLPPALAATVAALEAQLSGRPVPSSELPLDLRGTSFQHAVWQLLREVPFGSTTTYGELATRLGKPAGAARAVGGAVGANPLCVLIPCHRVVGRDGRLTGFAWGLALKEALLAREAAPQPGGAGGTVRGQPSPM